MPVWAAIAAALVVLSGEPVLAVVGALAWPPVEYAAHRWAMHGIARAWPKAYRRVHGVHHMYPTDTSHFTIPMPVVAIAAALVWSALWALGAPSPMAIVGGLLFAMVAYDAAHLAAHGILSLPFGKGLAARHAGHHAHPATNYGVTTGIIDRALGTYAPAHRARVCVVIGDDAEAAKTFSDAVGNGKLAFAIAPPGSPLATTAGERNMTDPGCAMVVQFADEVIDLSEARGGKKS
jgi:sterol desaturase/sphingolipid hydroxylase (fatty acid hydroxylase superfamily)